jgi:hypothetical protein
VWFLWLASFSPPSTKHDFQHKCHVIPNQQVMAHAACLTMRYASRL